MPLEEKKTDGHKGNLNWIFFLLLFYNGVNLILVL